MEDQLPPEPPAGKDISTLRFRFPDGSTKSRRFKQTAKISVLFIYIGSEGFAEVRLSFFLDLFQIGLIATKNSWDFKLFFVLVYFIWNIYIFRVIENLMKF